MRIIFSIFIIFAFAIGIVDGVACSSHITPNTPNPAVKTNPYKNNIEKSTQEHCSLSGFCFNDFRCFISQLTQFNVFDFQIDKVNNFSLKILLPSYSIQHLERPPSFS